MKKRIVTICLLVILMAIPGLNVYAIDSAGDLDLLTESMKTRESTYSSVTDIFKYNLFTNESIESLQGYAIIAENNRMKQREQLFAISKDYFRLDKAEREDIVLGLAQEKELFSVFDSSVSYKDTEKPTESFSTVTTIIIAVIVCLLSLVLSMKWNKRKRKQVMLKNEGEKHVY